MNSQNVKVDVEYCTECGQFQEFLKVSEALKKCCPSAEVSGREGRRGSLEVKINDELVHSRLSTLATPDHEDLCNICIQASEGKPVKTPCKTQNDCTIM